MNELLFFLTFILQVWVVNWLIKDRGLFRPLILLNLILIALMGAKQIEVFGIQTNVGNSLFAVIFYMLSLEAVRFEWRQYIAFLTRILFFYLLFVGVSSLVLAQVPVMSNLEFSQSLDSLFDFSFRIITASFLAFYFGSLTNYWVINRPKGALWKNKISGNILGQAVDSFVFFGFAFGNALPLVLLFEFMVGGFILKSILNILDTPFFLKAVKSHTKSYV